MAQLGITPIVTIASGERVAEFNFVANLTGINLPVTASISATLLRTVTKQLKIIN